jgi:hypothetical protein
MAEPTKLFANLESLDHSSILSTSSPAMEEKSGDFETLFRGFLTLDYLSPEGASSMQDAVNYLKSRVESDKISAVTLLLRDAENSMKSSDESATLHYVLRNIGLIAVATDACHKKEADRLIVTVDSMITDLVENSKETTSSLSKLNLPDAALRCLRHGFKVMVEGGDGRGFWHSRRSTKTYLIADLKILILSEMLLFDGTSFFFKSLLGSKWIDRAAVLCKETDPREVVRLTQILIDSEHWCSINGESYFKAVINIAFLWAAEQPLNMWDRMTANVDVFRVKSQCTQAKNILLSLFCGEGTDMMLFRLPNDYFAMISRAVFSHLCQKMIKKAILEESSLTVGEFAIELEKLYYDNKKFSNRGIRRQEIILGIFNQILLYLFSKRNFDSKSLWSAVCGLYELVQGHKDSTANRFFTVYLPRTTVTYHLLLATCYLLRSLTDLFLSHPLISSLNPYLSHLLLLGSAVGANCIIK